jgi:WXG100 family type VII secretion target
MGEIKIDYDKVVGVAKKLSNYADSIEGYQSKVEKQKGSISGQWVGLSKQAYEDLVNKWVQQSKKIVNDLNNISSSIKNTAEKYKKADEKSANLMDDYW